MDTSTRSIWFTCWLSCLVSLAGPGYAHASETPRRLILEPSPSPPADAVNLDTYYGGGTYFGSHGDLVADEDWAWRWIRLPEGLIYRSYLAGTKESRFSTHIVNESDLGWIWDATLGTRVGLLRYGTADPLWPSGFQIDAEGSAQLRLDLENQRDVVGVDFRAGVPLTFGVGRHRTKFGYYHLSSHTGDEFLLKRPGFRRLNYSRDVLVLGHSYYLNASLRLYAEAGWAFTSDVSEPWEFQFGVDYAPLWPTGCRGAPFFAINAHLREEIDFAGALTAETGWAWRSEAGRLLRAGIVYYDGKSNQFSFYNDHEEQIGFGLWYDF